MQHDRDSHELSELFMRSASRSRLFRGVRRLAVACSGGCDSIVLLDLLASSAPEHGMTLLVAHLDHAWRPESAEDAEFVAEQARRLGLELEIERAAPPGSDGSLEEQFREARLAFLRRVARRQACDAVALGHSRDDQAETVLMRLARGAGVSGLVGMAPRSRLGDLCLLRPLLPFSRSQLRGYADRRGLEWREDGTNNDLRFTRNRVRHEVLPALEAAIPGAVGNIARAAELIGDEDGWISEVALSELDRARLDDGRYPGVSLDAARLASLPVVLARRVVREASRIARGDLRGLDRDHVEAALAIAAGGGDLACDLPGLRVRREGSLLLLQAVAEEPVEAPEALVEGK